MYIIWYRSKRTKNVTTKKFFLSGLIVLVLSAIAAGLPYSGVGATTVEDCQKVGGGRNGDAIERCLQNAGLTEGDDCIQTSFNIAGTNCLPKNEGEATNRNPIFVLATYIMRFLSILVGLAVTGGIVWGGILYSTAQGNPGQTQKAVTVIANAIIGLLMFILMYAIINFLVPGGIFQ